MITMSVIASEKDVIHKIEQYLELNKFENIHVNYNKGEITAERMKYFFSPVETISLSIKQANEEATNIVFIVNPDHAISTQSDTAREIKLRNEIAIYL